MKITSTNKNSCNFKAIYFENYNSKYNNIQTHLRKELENFSGGNNNVTKLGEGVGGETFRFSSKLLRNFVIKVPKSGYKDDYEKEYKNLMSLPINKIGGQEAVARIYDSVKGCYGLVSSLVQGKTASMTNRYNTSYLKSLFTKMFELDKEGIYHGDLNGKNILLNNDQVNFIDYQWTQIVPKINIYDTEKVEKMLLPKSVFPENAQMFEMASIPYYIDSLWTSFGKENFVKKYLQAKSEYHENRAKHIKHLEPNWFSSEKHLIRQSLREESAKAKIYRNPEDDIIKLELKKFQFLSDYRDAFSHVDANLPNRNIIPSASSYLCALSAVQDFRKEIGLQLSSCHDGTKREYLKSMMEYGNYWYSNLKEYTSDTFDYIMRAILNNPNSDESKHHFYSNERNPREFSPNRDILTSMDSKYKCEFDCNFDVPYTLNDSIPNMYTGATLELSQSLPSDLKAMHQLEKVKNISKKSTNFSKKEQFLDLLNATLVATLKIREFRSYAKHNLFSYATSRILNELLEKTSNFSEVLFQRIFQGLKYEYPENILVKGYKNMRQFKFKL